MGKWFEIALWKRILAALVLGVIVGMIWGPGSESIVWIGDLFISCLLYTSPSPRDVEESRMPSSA